MAAAPDIQPTGAATLVAHNFEVLRDRTQALDETTVGLNARTLALETTFHELNSEIATRLKDIDLGLAKQTARLDAHAKYFKNRIDEIVGDATESDDEANLGNESMAVDESAGGTRAALRW